MAPDQCFVGGVTAFVALAQIILQIQARFDDLTAFTAANINPVDLLVLFPEPVTAAK